MGPVPTSQVPADADTLPGLPQDGLVVGDAGGSAEGAEPGHVQVQVLGLAARELPAQVDVLPELRVAPPDARGAPTAQVGPALGGRLPCVVRARSPEGERSVRPTHQAPLRLLRLEASDGRGPASVGATCGAGSLVPERAGMRRRARRAHAREAVGLDPSLLATLPHHPLYCAYHEKWLWLRQKPRMKEWAERSVLLQ